jgi:NTE family protein
MAKDRRSVPILPILTRLPKTLWVFFFLFVVVLIVLASLIPNPLELLPDWIAPPGKPNPRPSSVVALLLLLAWSLLASFAYVAFSIIVLVAAYNLAVVTHGKWTAAWRTGRGRRKPADAPAALPVGLAQTPAPEQPAPGPSDAVAATPAGDFKDIKKIGIVLAGGGAKGAFQAGAMKALYQLLADNNALSKVQVISATSIGSWNALFWLADLIKSENGGQSAHEKWWRSIRITSLVTPSRWIPGRRNSFLDAAPWQSMFDEIFDRDEIRKKIVNSNIHFYLTRSHVRSGRLECVTNNPEPPEIRRITIIPIDRKKNPKEFLKDVKDGVFASMDLPPLFPYMEIDHSYYEDGGVIDNLPVIFAAIESCDLIFVLALNSDFTAEPDHRSVLRRFLRVMEVRQGALEHGSLKTQYLYNEIAALRNYTKALEGALTDAKVAWPKPVMSESLAMALNRTHEESKVFGICPHRTLVESMINTHELWKSQEAGRAFAVMHKETARALKKLFDPSHKKIIMALVDENVEPSWVSDF